MKPESVGRSLRRAVVAVVTLAAVATLPGSASAQTYRGVPENGTDPWKPSGPRRSPAPPPSPDGRAGRPRPAEPAVHFVAEVGGDFGLNTLIEVPMSDGSTRTIKANQGGQLAAGLAFLKVFEGALATQATIGVKYTAISASNGSIRFLAFPLELMEYGYLEPLRLGVGVSYLLTPSLVGDGVADGLDVRYENSLGLVAEAGYVWRIPANSRGARVTFGVRYLSQKLEVRSGAARGPAVGANAFGFLLGFTG